MNLNADVVDMGIVANLLALSDTSDVAEVGLNDIDRMVLEFESVSQRLFKGWIESSQGIFSRVVGNKPGKNITALHSRRILFNL
jgi:hypothetical protein